VKQPLLLITLMLVGEPAFVLAADQQPPYSCRLLYAEQKKWAYGDRGNARQIEHYKKKCLRDGGRP
jgi:hypothetical protein